MTAAGRVLVVGYGLTGRAVARYLIERGDDVLVVDDRADASMIAAGRDDGVGVLVPPTTADGLDEILGRVGAVVTSPGVAMGHPVLVAAAAAGVPVHSEIELAGQVCAESVNTRLIAITGTNGKTTVTALTCHLLCAAGVDAVAAGNIPPAMLDALRERLDGARLPQAWVLELSSFQLHGVRDFAASAATVLNVTQDHLDWHGDLDAYAADKARIFGPAPWQLAQPPGLMLLNRDDPTVAAMRRDGRRACSFGLDAPTRDGDWGVVDEHGVAWLARAVAEVGDEPPSRRRGAPPPPPAPVRVQQLMPADALRIRGRHNWANALAALALAASTGAPLASLLHGLRDYRGEPHRMQSLGVLDGVEWIEDSKGTNVGATAAALHGLDRGVVLIAGGDGKGQDFAPLAAAARGRVHCALLIGRDAARLADALAPVCAVERCASLQAAAARAAEIAHSGEVVLLSPACASLDMFSDYKQRAEVFAAALHEIAAQRGVDL